MTAIVEWIPLLIEIGLKTYKYFADQKSEKELESTLKKAKSMLTEMEPFIKHKKQVSSEGKDFKQLIQTLEEGKRLVLEIETSDHKDRKKCSNQLQNWMQCFKDSLSSAMFRVFVGMASDVKQISQQLQLRQQQTTQLQIIHLHISPFPAHQQPPITEKEYNIAFQKFIHDANKFGGLQRLLPELEHVMTPKPKDVNKPMRRNVPQLTARDNNPQKQHKPASTAKTEDSKEQKGRIIHPSPRKDSQEHPGLKKSVSTKKTKDANVQKQRNINSSAEKDNNKRLESKPKGSNFPSSTEKNKKEKELKSGRATTMNSKKPKNNMRKVVLAVWARDEASKTHVESSANCVTGVISAKRIERSNQEKDLVIVKAKKVFVVDDLIKYLKKKLNRDSIIISDTPWDEK